MRTSSAEVGKEDTVRKYMYECVHMYVYMHTHAYTGIVFLYVHDHYRSI